MTEDLAKKVRAELAYEIQKALDEEDTQQDITRRCDLEGGGCGMVWLGRHICARPVGHGPKHSHRCPCGERFSDCCGRNHSENEALDQAR